MAYNIYFKRHFFNCRLMMPLYWVWIAGAGFIIILWMLLSFMKEKAWKSALQKKGGIRDIPVLEGQWPLLGHLPTFMSYPPEFHLHEHEKTFERLNSKTFICRAPGIPRRTFVLTVDPGMWVGGDLKSELRFLLME